ncbi:MAG: riboflavin biosynthesis protein RibF [Bacilli bacterium]|nr:riboflavin biosynthesis protein RibF [Bacilli bacterium]
MELIYLYSNDVFKDKMSNDTNLVCTIGVFDGIHKGHKLIFGALAKEAAKFSAKTVVFTFDPHPDYVLKKRENKGYLLLLDERINAFRQLGIDYCCIIRCDETLVNMPYQEFNARFLAEMDAIVVGEDFRYGKYGQGSVKTLGEVTSNLFIIPALRKEDGSKLGSEDIRNYLIEGNIDEANKLLLKTFKMGGIVTKGNKIGSKLGIKTANIKLAENDFCIKPGVYKCNAIIDHEKHKAICNIGLNPTVGLNNTRTLEVHILDFDQDLYGKFMLVEFEEFIRDEIKFNSVEELRAQILKDIEEVRK